MGGLVTCSRRGDCWDTLPHDPDSGGNQVDRVSLARAVIKTHETTQEQSF